MGKKEKKSKTTSGDAEEDYRLSYEAIKNSTGLVNHAKVEKVRDDIYLDENNYCDVVVVTLDIRKSSIALVNVEDFEEYSNVITDYVCYVVETCQNKKYPCKFEAKDNKGKVKSENGWFDKFTGDGVIVFWRLPIEPYEDKKYYDMPKKAGYNEKLKHYKQMCNETVRVAIEFSIRVTEQFLENALPDIRKTCGLLPADFGMSVGIDAGNCLLTELKASENYEERCERYGVKYTEDLAVSQNVTAIGRAIIGANRMVQKAKPYEIIVNSYPGSNLKEAMEDSKEEVGRGVKFSLERTIVCTKEYNPVEAYRVVSGHLEHLKRTKTFCDRVKKTREEKAKATSKQEDMETGTKDAESQGDSE